MAKANLVDLYRWLPEKVESLPIAKRDSSFNYEYFIKPHLVASAAISDVTDFEVVSVVAKSNITSHLFIEYKGLHYYWARIDMESIWVEGPPVDYSFLTE